MKWKKFKKERISLNYTVMLVPHSQKKMIHFKTPVWIFGAFFLGLLVLTGACLFFAGSRHQLAQVRREKARLEVEWEQLARQKEQAEKENDALRQEQEYQEQELQKLEQRARNTLQELEALVDRESQIRQELGLTKLPGETSKALAGEDSGEKEDSELTRERQTGEEPGEAVQEGSRRPDPSARTLQIASTDMPMILKKNSTDLAVIQSELSYMQNCLNEKQRQYDSYMNTIKERKEAAAAEKLRKEALRASIVTSALRYVGNPYVYGGNNPNTGVDCSGFTRYVLGNTAGVYLNRTAAEQSSQGKAVSAQEARPGDLVFYSNGSSINHVAIYIGEGRVVHASNERVGIVTSDMYYRTPVKIKNVLGD